MRMVSAGIQRGLAEKSMFRSLVKHSSTIVTIVSLLGTFAAAHAGQAVPQITQPVDNSARVTLHGNTHPLATAANDRGMVPASTAADRMLLLLKRPAEQEAALQQ